MSQRCPVCNETIEGNVGSCPSCGFKLPGTTEEFKPISLEGGIPSGPSFETKTANAATMTIVRGPQIGTIYQLDDKVLSVGRSPQCDIFLNDMTVSR
ncbi:MAG: FHA domain-containing protein, partial [Eggerthellaceae bacterium]|nr:FHA domain-containing protein [Eggerthellaceae bacterium]